MLCLTPRDKFCDPVLELPKGQDFVSNPKTINACTTDLKNIPDNLGLSPSIPSILSSVSKTALSFDVSIVILAPGIFTTPLNDSMVDMDPVL